MVPAKGRSLLKQNLPNRPHKWGFKLWVRSSVSGYLYDFNVMCTKGKEKASRNTSGHGIGAYLVAGNCSSHQK